MTSDTYDAVLADWILCEVRGDRRFLAGKVTGDRTLRFPEGAYITTSLILGSVEAIADGNIIETVNSRYLLKDRYQVDDAIFAKLDAWLDAQATPPTPGDLMAAGDVQLLAAHVLRAFRAATAEAVWRRNDGE